MNVQLEIFFTKIVRDKLLYVRVVHDISDKQESPEVFLNHYLIHRFHKDNKLIGDETILHSTSWCYEDEGAVVITYLIYSDFLDLDKVSHKELQVLDVASVNLEGDSTNSRPRPTNLLCEQVLVHGMRHLAFLVNHRKSCRKVLKPSSKRDFALLPEHLAGEIILRA